MRGVVKPLVWVSAVLGLAGCDYVQNMMGKKVSCSDATAQTVVHDLIKTEIENQLKLLTGDDGRKKFELAKIRASVSQLQYALESVRTSKEDPNSSKVFCEASFSVTVPAAILDDANVTLKEADAVDDNVEDALDRYGFKKSGSSANVYQAHILYAVQPTDDGKQVYAEIENAASLSEGLSDLLDQSMSKHLVLDAKNAQLKAEAQAQAEEMRLISEQEAAVQKEILAEEARMREIELVDQAEQQARLKQVQEENKLYKSQLNRIWGNLDESIQVQIEGAQKAWVDEKTAACKKESLNAYGSDTELEIVRLQCDSKWVQKRIREYQSAF